MKKFILPLFLFSSLTFFAQDTIYYNSQWEEVQLRESASYYGVLEFENANAGKTVKRDYTIDGIMLSEKTFSDYEAYELDGIMKEWREDGSLKLVATYKKGEKDGYLVTYWENGQMKRSDRFKNGELVNGTCWNEDGVEVPYFNYSIPPQFPGGLDALKLYLKKNTYFPKEIMEEGSFRVVVGFAIDKSGVPAHIEVLEGDVRLKYAAFEVVDKMPAWSPGKIDGELVQVRYKLPLIFVK